MKKIFPVLFGFTLLLAACSKDNSSGGGTTTVSYQPVTAGSTWTYHVDNKKNAAASFNFILTSTNKDTSINSKSYHVFTNSTGGNEYYFHSGSDYFQQASLTGLDQGLELLYLKDAAVGTSWSETKSISIGGFAVPTTFNYSIDDKLATYVVGSNTFNNVLKVKVTLVPTGITIASQKLEFYYAPNVGRVKSEIQLSVPLASVDVNTETSLQSSTIK
jgi:hypothetical protein